MAYFQEMDSTFIYPEATALEAKGTYKVLREKLLPPPNIPILKFFFLEDYFPCYTLDQSTPALPHTMS